MSGPPGPARSPRVCVLVLTWNGLEWTIACIDSVLAMTYRHYEVVIVDNASGDGTPDALRARYGSRVRVLENDRNLLFAGGMNAGLAHALAADFDAVLLLNNDVVVDPGLLDALVDALQTDPRIAAAGPKIYFLEPPDRIWFAGGEFSLWSGWSRHRGIRETDRGQYDAQCDVDYLTGCAYLVRREALADVGLFDTGYAMYAEDADWSFRARARGWRLVYAPQARMWHRVSASAGTRSWFKVRRRAASQLRFWGRHARWYHALTIPFGTLAEVARVGWLLLRRRV